MITRFFKCVEAAFYEAKSLLWPFHKNVWFKLLFLYLLSGGCGGSDMLQIPTSFSDVASSVREKSSNSSNPSIPILNSKDSKKDQDEKKLEEWVRSWGSKSLLIIKENIAAIIFLVEIVIVLLAVIWVFFLWLGSRLKMVVIKSLLKNDVQIIQEWKQTEQIGNSFARFNIYFSFILLLLIFIPCGLIIYKGFSDIAYLKTHVFSLIGTSVGLIFIIAGAILIYYLVNQFLPIYLSLTNKSIADFFREIRLIRFHGLLIGLGYMVLYWLVSAALGIGAATVGGLFLIPIILVFVPLGFAAAFLAKWIGTIAQILIWAILGSIGAALVVVVFSGVVVLLTTFLIFLRIELVKLFQESRPQA